jgi:DnaJ-domain-containing protein 1
MNFDSPLFDRIRVKPENDRRRRTEEQPACEWPGCDCAATHRAPKGRGMEQQYWRFCLDHVREYNHSYNFFKDMPAEAVASYQKDALTGHRPTWRLGSVGGKGRSARLDRGPFASAGSTQDPFSLFGDFGAARARPQSQEKPARTVHNVARKAIHALGLEIDATKAEIKARFKELVKRHHPDANGGDRASEDKLREIIVAYNYLKSAGFC